MLVDKNRIGVADDTFKKVNDARGSGRREPTEANMTLRCGLSHAREWMRKGFFFRRIMWLWLVCGV
jgi:hypothetical protein